MEDLCDYIFPEKYQLQEGLVVFRRCGHLAQVSFSNVVATIEAELTPLEETRSLLLVQLPIVIADQREPSAVLPPTQIAPISIPK